MTNDAKQLLNKKRYPQDAFSKALDKGEWKEIIALSASFKPRHEEKMLSLIDEIKTSSLMFGAWEAVLKTRSLSLSRRMIQREKENFSEVARRIDQIIEMSLSVSSYTEKVVLVKSDVQDLHHLLGCRGRAVCGVDLEEDAERIIQKDLVPSCFGCLKKADTAFVYKPEASEFREKFLLDLDSEVYESVFEARDSVRAREMVLQRFWWCVKDNICRDFKAEGYNLKEGDYYNLEHLYKDPRPLDFPRLLELKTHALKVERGMIEK